MAKKDSFGREGGESRIPKLLKEEMGRRREEKEKREPDTGRGSMYWKTGTGLRRYRNLTST